MNKINYTFHNLSTSVITNIQLYYVINTVLMSQILCLTSNFTSIQKIEAKIKLLFKIKCKFQRSTPSAIINSKPIYNIPCNQDRIYRQAVVNFIEVLNQTGIHNASIFIRLQALQNYVWSTSPIWVHNFKHDFP